MKARRFDGSARRPSLHEGSSLDEVLGSVRSRARRRDLASRVATAFVAVVIALAAFALVLPAIHRHDPSGTGVSAANSSISEVSGTFFITSSTDSKYQVASLGRDGSTQPLADIESALRPYAVASPDGTKLYVMSSSGAEGTLSVLRAEDGAVIDSQTFVHPPAIQSPVPPQTLAAGNDRVFLMQTWTGGPDEINNSIAVYDTASKRLLADPIQIGRCGADGFMNASRSGDVLTIACPDTGSVILVSFGPDGSPVTRSVPVDTAQEVDFPNGHPDAIEGSILSPDQASVEVVTEAGLLTTIDIASGEASLTAQLAIPEGTYVSYGGFRPTGDGSAMLLLGSMNAFDRFTADQVAVVIATSGEVRADYPLNAPIVQFEPLGPGEIVGLDRSGNGAYVASLADAKSRMIDFAPGTTPIQVTQVSP